jgi:hypothetical protein
MLVSIVSKLYYTPEFQPINELYNLWFKIMKETDLDHDGAMSFQEFERVMTLRGAPEFLQ